VRRDKVPNPKSAETAGKSLPAQTDFNKIQTLWKKCVQLIEFPLRLALWIVLVKE
jgi:hypothetical protein